MEEKNYYEILEVSKNASAEIIKTAYKSLIKKYHPDNTGNTDDNKKIIEIREAYEVLSDPKRKKAYDELIKAKNDKEPYSTKYQRVSNTQKIYHKSEKKRAVLGIIIFCILIWGIRNTHFNMRENEMNQEVEVMISVQRTGNILTNIGKLGVWIDDEKVFEVNGNSTNSVVVTMTVGRHTIQTKGQGDKSKK